MPLRLSLSLLLAACAFSQIPTPESVLGHKPGDDFYLASYDDALGYFKKLAAASDRVRLIPVGKTTRGADWQVALISTPKNLANFERYKEISRKLGQARGLTDDAAKLLAREGKAIVHIDGGLHSTEVAGGQHSIQLAYNLASAQGDPEIDSILENCILVLWFSLNPDGQNMVVNWYRRNLGTPYEVSPLPELYQEYVGHDNNRDGYMNNMVESQIVTKAEIDFNAVVFYCQHQSAPVPTRIWIPPFAEPISSNIHPVILRWLNVYGTNMSAYLEEHGMPGAVHRGNGFDNWYPGFLDYTHIFRNTVSFFTETALYRYATPHFYTVDDFPKDKQDLRGEVFYSSPWRGGWWRLGDAVRYMLGGSMSVLETSSKFRETLLYNRYQAARDTVARFSKEPPYAYVIPANQRDPGTAATLVDKLIINGLEAYQATKPVRLNGIEYSAGAWVIPMDQPFAALAKELLEVQRYPDLRDYPGGPPDLPYDVAGWTLPLQMGVETLAVTEPIPVATRAALRPIPKAEITGSVSGVGKLTVFPHASNASVAAVNEAMTGGASASLAPLTGDYVISNIDRTKAEAIAKKQSLKATTADQAPADALPLKKPRVALYRPWQPSIDEGWSRWILENYGFAPITIRNADFQAGHLRDRFDTILIPDIQERILLDGFRPGIVPGEFTGGLGENGVEGIRDFVRSGGTLVTLNNASLFAIHQLQLPVDNILDGVKSDQFFCSGSLLKIELREPSHPLTFGLPAEPTVMFERGPAFDVKPGFQGKVIASYPRERNPLMSGYLLHPERIQGKAAVIDANLGKGHVVLIGFRPQWRGQSHGAYLFLFNALYYSAALAPKLTPAGAGERFTPSSAALRAELPKLLELNRSYFAAKGPAAQAEASKLDAALDQFRQTRLASLEYYRAGELVTQWRRLLVDLKLKEISGSTDAVVAQYRLLEP